MRPALPLERLSCSGLFSALRFPGSPQSTLAVLKFINFGLPATGALVAPEIKRAVSAFVAGC
ncbi:hypothetical protein CW753_28425 (plasmid) [Klebsiella pneumoniae]|nr:hypothetical protein CW753_28425 [Klebsiella pneumoniae]